VKNDVRQLIHINTRFVTLSSLFKNVCLEIIHSFFIMLTKLIIEQRRNLIANCRYKHAFILMRSCRTYVSFNVLYRINREYLKCEKCYWKNRKCNLASNYQKINKTIKKIKKLDDKITKLRLRIAHKTKQRKH